MNLVRNLKTETVHRADCSTRGADVGTWNWAAPLGLVEVKAATIAYPWLHLCRTCLPGVCECGKCGAA